MKKIIPLALSVGMLCTIMTGCGDEAGVQTDSASSEKAEQVTLTIAGPWSDCAAMETTGAAFTKKNPEIHIEYEFIQNFDENLPKRLAQDEDKIDLFLSGNIQKDSDVFDYALELSSLGEKLDISNTFDGLLENSKLQSKDEADVGKFYSLYLGAEMRGMYVNTTLLDSMGISVPTNRDELLSACKTISANGYIPLQGNPGMFGQEFLYPYVCNIVANSSDYKTLYDSINNKDEGISETFRDPCEFLYSLVESNYYNYKYAETELGLFLDTSNEGCAKDFFNVLADDEGNFTKKDDLGQIAFMPFYRSAKSVMKKTKEDYHSEIEYDFILSPVSDEGGYAYLSPGRAIGVNKNSDYVDESVEFLNFLFEEDNNIAFCDEMGFIPNTKNAYDLIKKEYNVPETNISQLGDVTFGYDFFSVINDTLIEVSKSNNPKYMNTDESGNSVMYPFSYYMDNFEARFHTDE